MTIKIMGQLGEPHESAQATALRSFKDVSSIASNLGNMATNAANAKTSKTNAETMAKNSTTREGELSAALASQEIKKAEANFKYTKDAHARYSKMWDDMDEIQRGIFLTSDQNKEFVKLFKGASDIMPGLVDEQGKVRTSTRKDRNADAYTEALAGAKLRISKGADGGATKEDFNLAKMDKAGTGDNFIKVLTELEEAIIAKEVEPDKPNVVQAFIADRMYKHMLKKQNNAAIDRGVKPADLAPAGANPNDPLGLLGG